MTPQADISRAAQEELDRVLASGILGTGTRQVRLLQYIVQRSLVGDRESLKEYSIGLDVFDRDSSFDPKIDSIVRSTARQLRVKLSEYYESTGRESPVRIRLPKGSYIAVIEQNARAAPAADAEHRVRWRLWIGVAAMIVAGIAVAGWRLERGRGSAPRRLAVLPFRDYSPHQDLDYFASGLRDGLTSGLVHTKGLEVTARASSAQLFVPGRRIVDAAASAHADSVVTGSVSPAGNKLQVVVALVDGKTGNYLWSGTYQATAADLAVIEHNAASGIAHALGVPTDIPVPSLPRSPEALDLYLRACSLARTRLPPQCREAAQLFERAIKLEPDFAPACAAAASNYLVGVFNSVMTWRDVGPRGMELAHKALDLDPTLADGHAALAVGWQAQLKWREADAELSQAIELDPRYPAAYFRRAFNLAILGRFQDAEHVIEIARTLDPTWSAANGLLGEIYYYERRYDDALALVRRFRETEPVFFDNLAANVYQMQGRFDLARQLISKIREPFVPVVLRAMDGDTREVYKDLLALRSRTGIPAHIMARYTMALLHDKNLTLDWFEQSLHDHEPNVVTLAIDPMFDSIRDHPRSVAILRQLNLSD